MLNCATALSILLSFLTVALWVRTYYASDRIGMEYGRPHPEGWVEQHFWGASGQGWLRLWFFREVNRLNDPTHPYQPLPKRPRVFHEQFEPKWTRTAMRPQWQWAGLEAWKQDTRFPERNIRAWFVGFPLGYLALLLVSLPSARLIATMRQRNLAGVGRCDGCGYDLRATPGRCPECGTVPAGVREPPHNPPMHRTGPAV